MVGSTSEVGSDVVGSTSEVGYGVTGDAVCGGLVGLGVTSAMS